jgi:TusA-related sulfurtransferase
MALQLRYEMRENHMCKLDLRNGVTPFSLLHVINLFRRMKPGETLEILGNDQDLEQDLKRILPEASFQVVALEQPGDYVAYIWKPALH